MVSRPQALSEQDLRDLGFGSVVSRESQQRLLNRDGSFNVERRGLGFWSSFSLYHALLTISWWHFFLIFAGSYFVANALFAFAYLACGSDALAGSTLGLENHAFLRAFFFSVETLSTIGYGNVAPTRCRRQHGGYGGGVGRVDGLRHRHRAIVRPLFASDSKDSLQPSRGRRSVSGHHRAGVSSGQRALQ